jgi:DNA-binding transcriptional LysR family regulator
MEAETALSSYHIFNAVAEAGNLSKAAKALTISQPAISRAVSKLEQSLCVKLFIRGSRGVRLTEEGQLLYRHTKSAFDSLRQGEENIRRLTGLGAGHLRIGVSTTLCKHILMPYLKQFVEEYPHIQISIQCHCAKETLELLEQGNLDIGLVSRAENIHPLEFLPVTEIEPVFVATETYLKNITLQKQSDVPSAKNRRSAAKKTPGDLLTCFKNGTLMLPDKNTSTRSYIEEYLNKQQIETGQITEVESSDLMLEFSKIGLGIGCVIKEFVQEELTNHSLIELPLPNKTEKQTVGFVYKKTHYQSGSIQKFIDFYKGDSK